MDNASRALIMAGSVMIAIAIISTALYAVTKGRGFAQNAEALLSASQIQSFNRFYTAYNSVGASPKEIDCIDGINLLNRAIEDEIIATDDSSLIIEDGGRFTIDDDRTENYTKSVKAQIFADDTGKVSRVLITD